MRRLIIIAGLGLLQATEPAAQKTPDPAKTDIKTTPVMKAPVRTQTIRIKTAPVSETPPVATAPGPNSWDFHLTSAKVTIYTGNDNKEQPSQVQMQMTFGNEGVGNYMIPIAQYREFPVNSATELAFKFYYDPTYKYDKLSLAFVESGGMKFYIHYSPNFILDAWKIEKVVFTVEFRDGKGNLHPAIGTKNILFTNIGAVLKEEVRSLVCEVDKFLMPTTAKAYTIK
jgi:hypothetical protein